MLPRLVLPVLLLLGTSSAWAGCVTIDSTGFPQEKRNLRQALAYGLAVKAGSAEAPTIAGEDICFPTFDPTGVITSDTLETAYQNHIADNNSITSAQSTEEAELAALHSQLQTLYDSLTDAQKAGLQGKLLRMKLLERRLGR